MFKGKVALVTGAASGMGRELIKKFAFNGANVLFTGRARTKENEDMENFLKNTYQVDCLYHPAQLTKRNEIEDLVDVGLKKFNKIDILINTAGLAHSNLFWETTPENFQEVIDINLTAPYLLARKVVPVMMKNNWGRVINVSSATTLVGEPTLSAYMAAKSGLRGLTKSLAREVGKNNITVNTVVPGIVRTKMLEKGLTQVAQSTGKTEEEVLASFLTKSAVGRLIEPEEIADLIIFLSSDQAKSITGAEYVMDGGHSI